MIVQGCLFQYSFSFYVCVKFFQKTTERRNQDCWGGQSELLSPGGAGAFQINLNKPVNSLLTINWMFIQEKTWLCVEGNRDYKSSFLILPVFTFFYYVLHNLKSFSYTFSLPHSPPLYLPSPFPGPYLLLMGLLQYFPISGASVIHIVDALTFLQHISLLH